MSKKNKTSKNENNLKSNNSFGCNCHENGHECNCHENEHSCKNCNDVEYKYLFSSPIAT
jgi:hypothetical protein